MRAVGLVSTTKYVPEVRLPNEYAAFAPLVVAVVREAREAPSAAAPSHVPLPFPSR